MLSIANVKAEQASNYYSNDGYYVRMENQGDCWQGRLKEKLKLPDEVTKEDFNKLINERKTRAGSKREKRAGYDLCLSAPKSVSVAMILNDEARQDMINAHNKAVKEVLEKIEQREIGARITKDGITEHIKTGNMIAGCFNHYVSRNSDPQLHTHAVILNKTKYKNKFYAVDNPDLYKNEIMYGQLYRNALAKELMAKGYEVIITDTEKGFFELKGIDKNVLVQFSSRRQEIEQKLKEWDAHSSAAASKAALVTRKAKEHKNLDLLIKSWRETLNEMGGVTLDKNNAPIVPADKQKRLEFQQAIERLERSSVAFTERDLKKAVLATGVSSGLTEGEYEEFVKSDSNLVSIDVFNNQRGSDGEAYYTTRKNIEIEKAIFNEVSRTKNSMAASAVKADKARGVVNEALKKDNSGLSEQQFNAVMHIATSKDQYSAIQGLAGTGKTHMLNYARIVLENEGYTVKGACFTGKAAQGLQEGAKIDSKTIHSFLNRLEREVGNYKPGEDMQNKVGWNLEGLKAGDKEAWIVDEASMVDNNILRHLMEAARQKKAKVILVGDRQQLLPVGAGNAFSLLTVENKISTVRLTEIRRQEDTQLLQAVKEAVSGSLTKSLEILDKDTKIIEKHKARIKAITNDYTALTREEQQSTVILTAGNSDRQLLNESIRKALKKQKHLSDGQIFAIEDVRGKNISREFSVDDKIIFLQNDNRLGVRNGQIGYITKIENNFITVLSDKKEIVVNVDTYKKIDYGYAMTTHKAQGITVDRVLINLDSSQAQLNNRNAYYVDISRARHKVSIYVDDKEKISRQVNDFAKKITSEDFLIKQAAENTKKKERTDINDFNIDDFITKTEVTLSAEEVSKLVSEHESKLNAELKELIRVEQLIVKEKNELWEGYRDEAAKDYFEEKLQLEIDKLDSALENLAMDIDNHNSAGLMKKLFGNYNQEAAELTDKKLELESAKDNIIKNCEHSISRASQGVMGRNEQNIIDEMAKGIARKNNAFFDKKINDFDAKILKIAGQKKDLSGKIKDCREVRAGLGDLAKSPVKFETRKEEFAHKEVVEIMRKLPAITKEMGVKVGKGISFGR